MKTIMLVHGAWADGSSWDKVVPLLIDKGHKVVAVHLPLSSLADDVAAVTGTCVEEMEHAYTTFLSRASAASLISRQWQG